MDDYYYHHYFGGLVWFGCLFCIPSLLKWRLSERSIYIFTSAMFSIRVLQTPAEGMDTIVLDPALSCSKQRDFHLSSRLVLIPWDRLNTISSHAGTDELTARLRFPLHLSPAAERKMQSGKESFRCVLNFRWSFQQQILMHVHHLLCLVHQRAMTVTEALCAPLTMMGLQPPHGCCSRSSCAWGTFVPWLYWPDSNITFLTRTKLSSPSTTIKLA